MFALYLTTSNSTSISFNLNMVTRSYSKQLEISLGMDTIK